MTIRLLLKKLRLDNKKFLTSEILRKYCEESNLNYTNTVNYLLRKGFLVRIFRGVFYLRSFDELKLAETKYNYLELVAQGLKLKGVENWYFGLYTALKLNNLTHEYFALDYVLNDKIFRAKAINIAGHRFKFHKISSKLLKFGVEEYSSKGITLRYSNPEKTILDFVYIWRYNGISKDRIVLDLKGYVKDLSSEKLFRYALAYPKSVRSIAEELIE